MRCVDRNPKHDAWSALPASRRPFRWRWRADGSRPRAPAHLRTWTSTGGLVGDADVTISRPLAGIVGCAMILIRRRPSSRCRERGRDVEQSISRLRSGKSAWTAAPRRLIRSGFPAAVRLAERDPGRRGEQAECASSRTEDASSMEVLRDRIRSAWGTGRASDRQAVEPSPRSRRG